MPPLQNHSLSDMIGSVSYLNAKPLIHGLPPEELVLEVPSTLSKRFSEGGLDAALLPVFEIFQFSHPVVVDGISISCLGPVKSVVVATPGPFHDVRDIYPDPASVTSNSLLKILLAEFFPSGPQVVLTDEPIPEMAARLLIGDRALEFQMSFPSWQYFDLGECWFQNTGLPFVFAAWCLRPPPQTHLADLLRLSCQQGLSQLAEIAKATAAPADSHEYLTKNIRFGLGESEKAALALFGELAVRHGLLTKIPDLVWI